MYHETISKLATELESDLQYAWKSINIKLIEAAEYDLLFAFTFKMDDDRPDSECSLIKNRCFSSKAWRPVEDILDREYFLEYVRRENLVEIWNSDFHHSDVYQMTHGLEHDVEDFLASEEVEKEVRRVAVSENLDEDDLEEFMETIQHLNAIIRCDTDDFWTEEMLIEVWEMIGV